MTGERMARVFEFLKNKVSKLNYSVQSLVGQMDRAATKNDIIFLMEELGKKATNSKVLEHAKQFVRVEALLELNSKMDLLKDDIEQRAKTTFVKTQVESISNEFKEVINDFATHDSVLQSVDIIEAKIK